LPQEMAIGRQISRVQYSRRCIEGSAVEAYRRHGVAVAAGMKIRYVVTDARRHQAEPAWCAQSFDCAYYRQLLDAAWEEIAFAFRQAGAGVKAGREAPLPVTYG